jgi:replicative DNA helicase
MIDSVSSEGESRAWENARPADLKNAKRVRQPNKADTVERKLPQSPDMEQAILSCIFISPREVMPQVILKFGNVGGEMLYDLQNYTIYNVMEWLHENLKSIDTITVMQRLKDLQLLEQCGGVSYLSSLPDVAPSAANLSYYLEIVCEKYLLRKTIQTCTNVIASVYEHEGDVDSLLDGVERDILKIRAIGGDSELRSMKDNVKEAVEQIEDYQQHLEGCLGLSTGFADLDKMTSGMMPGEVFIIAARPGFGKTSLAMNIAEHVAVELKMPVGVFSMEMTVKNLVLRMICSRARVNLRNVKEGYLAERDFPRITGSAGKLATANIWIDDESSLPIMRLRAKARRMMQKYGIKLFVIDYLQLAQAFIGKRRIENRQQEIAEISGGIKAMAKELGVPIIALAQVDRALDKAERKPVMSDLRESGAIEQDADFVGFLYKEKRNDQSHPIDFDCVPTNLLIAKQRNGGTGEVNLVFIKSLTRFESASKVSDDDVPNNSQEVLI